MSEVEINMRRPVQHINMFCTMCFLINVPKFCSNTEDGRIIIQILFQLLMLCVFDVGCMKLSGEHWWNDTDRRPKCSEKTLFSATLSVTDVTLTGLGTEMGFHVGCSKQEASTVRLVCLTS
jgi:hypothetical protein